MSEHHHKSFSSRNKAASDFRILLRLQNVVLMLERLDKRGTLRLLVAMKELAESDVRRYGTKAAKSSHGSNYIGKNCYISARYYLDEELPAIREALGESFRES